MVADCFGAPNGLVFPIDERRLFISHTRAGVIRGFDVRKDGTLSNGEVIVEARARDAVRFDSLRSAEGGLLRAAGMDDGVHCHDPDGTLIGRLNVPVRVANIPGGGAERNRLLIAAEKPPLGDHGRHRHVPERRGPPAPAAESRVNLRSRQWRTATQTYRGAT